MDRLGHYLASVVALVPPQNWRLGCYKPIPPVYNLNEVLGTTLFYS